LARHKNFEVWLAECTSAPSSKHHIESIPKLFRFLASLFKSYKVIQTVLLKFKWPFHILILYLKTNRSPLTGFKGLVLMTVLAILLLFLVTSSIGDQLFFTNIHPFNLMDWQKEILSSVKSSIKRLIWRSVDIRGFCKPQIETLFSN